MNERVLRNNEYIEHVEKNVLVLRTPSYNELDVTIFWNIALVINNALDVTIVRSSTFRSKRRRTPNRRVNVVYDRVYDLRHRYNRWYRHRVCLNDRTSPASDSFV